MLNQLPQPDNREIDASCGAMFALPEAKLFIQTRPHQRPGFFLLNLTSQNQPLSVIIHARKLTRRATACFLFLEILNIPDEYRGDRG